jgi:ribosome maturation factor RimP
MNEEVTMQVWQLAEPLAASEGLEIFDIEYRRERSGMVLRVFLDRAEGQGVTLDELTSVSRQLSDLLDVHDVVPGAYLLEVSSPGINRRLRRPDHFRRYVGARVRVRTTEPIDGRKAFAGQLAAVEPWGIVLRYDNGEVVIPFEKIAQANLEAELEAMSGPKARHGSERR